MTEKKINMAIKKLTQRNDEYGTFFRYLALW